MVNFFPSKVAVAPTPHDVLESHRRTFAARVSEGTMRPLVLPYHLYGIIALEIYLCIPHINRPLLYKARWIVLAGIIWFELKTLFNTSSENMAVGFAAGLFCTFSIVTSLNWLVFMKPQFEAKRVERRKGWKGSKDTEEEAHQSENYRVDGEDSELRQRGQTNGNASRSASKDDKEGGQVAQKGSSEETEYYWQSYPDNIWERIDWVVDLVTNFRGPAWNWQVPNLPELPPFVKSKLGEPITEASRRDTSSSGIRRFNTRYELFRAQVPRFIIGYFLLDITKTLMMNDPYFYLGPNNYPVPSYVATMSPVFRSIYRQLLSMTAILTSLEMTFLIAPLIMCLLLGPSVLGLRGESWYYPTTWGSFSVILNKGLAGLWGSWWHQIFRLVFSSPTTYLISQGYLNPKSVTTKLVASLIAFGISGILHSGGSLSQIAPTRPWHPFLFFMLQALGIVIQMALAMAFKGVIRKVPKGARQATNAAYALGWGLLTGWVLADDFARGGLWLYEPIPVSVLRGLGYGYEGEGWWCWEHVGVGWFRGRGWWDSGVAI
ncbi:membrane bound o-acyl transferase family domain-containing protein [Rutstroemia sp. NJR-2017a BVV2]|nr:membrane bound o-acyl transferase family domain-containing protein [Rutstroemia sp. NJR-2017a BVV2]